MLEMVVQDSCFKGLRLRRELVPPAVDIVFSYQDNESSILGRVRSLHLYGSGDHTKVIPSRVDLVFSYHTNEGPDPSLSRFPTPPQLGCPL
jgi:hypothetical protein